MNQIAKCKICPLRSPVSAGARWPRIPEGVPPSSTPHHKARPRPLGPCICDTTLAKENDSVCDSPRSASPVVAVAKLGLRAGRILGLQPRKQGHAYKRRQCENPKEPRIEFIVREGSMFQNLWPGSWLSAETCLGHIRFGSPQSGPPSARGHPRARPEASFSG